MSCQGPDGLKVICRLPDLVNVFVLLAQSVSDIEKSGLFDEYPGYAEAFHVLYRLAKRIAARLNALSVRLNKYRDYLVQLITEKADEKTRPILLQKVTTVMQDLRQEMAKIAPKLSQAKQQSRDVGNMQAVQRTRRLITAKEAQLEPDDARAEKSLVGSQSDTSTVVSNISIVSHSESRYRSTRTDEEMMEPQQEMDKASMSLTDIQEMFRNFHIIARVDPSMMKLEQDIGDFLTEILMLFQEEIVELKMLIRMCQSSITGSEKDKDRKMLKALERVREHLGGETEEDADEIAIEQTDCVPTSRDWKTITNHLMDQPRLMM